MTRLIVWLFCLLIQKEYLIIIIISPKYYETVAASPVGFENDERTFNTVYIHKQVSATQSRGCE